MLESLKARESHFEFGSNWLDFIEIIDERRISDAVRGLARIFPNGELRGRRVLDIGSGSGLSMLAALRLGAAEVIGVDIDENSVAAARRLLERFVPGARWRASQLSVFDVGDLPDGPFDVVYSWGVLHHTGDMWTAIEGASKCVAEGGLLAIAIYRKTPFCGLWRGEKRFYAHMPSAIQAPIRWLYKAAFLAGQTVCGRNPIRYVRNYGTRGMSWTHDVHDWLGGYPYESASPIEIRQRLEALGFLIEREEVPVTSWTKGIFGSGCNEYVARRSPSSPDAR